MNGFEIKHRHTSKNDMKSNTNKINYMFEVINNSNYCFPYDNHGFTGVPPTQGITEAPSITSQLSLKTI